MKILVVDDSATMRRIIIKNLNSCGYHDIIQATNGEEAVALLTGVDLIMTDWIMPVMDGLSLVRYIRSKSETKDIPIIMVTSQAAQKEVIEALKNGVNDYIVKPFTARTLVEKVESLVKKSHPLNA